MESIRSYKELWKAFYEHACDLSHFLKTRVDIDNQLKKQDAPRLKLQNIRLEEVYADDIMFTNIDFYNVDFRNCMFTGIDFINCTFDSCGIECCCFTKRRNYIGVIKSCKFKNVDISKSYFYGYNILLCFFDDCDILDCNFNNTTLVNSNVENSSVLNSINTVSAGENNIFKNVYTNGIICPEEGSFIGWKYITFPVSVLENSEQHTDWCAVLVKLKIPEDAKRSSGFSRKCRASKVEVLGFYATDGTRLDDIYEVNHLDVFPIVYKIGEYTYPDSFNEDRYAECSHGIHFFVSKDDAIQYGKDNVRGLIFVEHADDDDFAYTKLKETVNGYKDATNKDS